MLCFHFLYVSFKSSCLIIPIQFYVIYLYIYFSTILFYYTQRYWCGEQARIATCVGAKEERAGDKTKKAGGGGQEENFSIGTGASQETAEIRGGRQYTIIVCVIWTWTNEGQYPLLLFNASQKS